MKTALRKKTWPKESANESPRPQAAPFADELAERPLTISMRIHSELRGKIIALELPPGAPLSEKDLIRYFGVSRTPVREALLRLGEEQLVDIYPQSGTFVARIRVSVAQDAMVIRNALERFSAREAASRATLADVAALDATIARQREAAAADDVKGFHAADEAMHQLLASVAGRPNIWRVVKREKANIDRVRLLTLQFRGRFEAVIAEHRRIVEAVRARQPAKAEAAMSAHLGRVLPGLESVREQYPDYFEKDDADPPRTRAARRPR